MNNMGFFNPFGSSGSGGGSNYNNLTNKPVINGVTVQGSLTTGDLLITAADVGALPSETKYGADFALSIDSQTFVVTAQLKDQDGNNLGQARTIDLPLETMVIGGRYDDQTQKIILTLKNGQTVEFSVADLVSGLQTELSASNKLDPSYIEYDSTHAAVTDSDKTTWSGKQDAINDLSTIRSGSEAGATAVQTIQINGTAQTKTGGVVNLPAYPTKSSLGLGNVDNTSDLNKPISTAVAMDQTRQETEIGDVANRGAKNLLPDKYAAGNAVETNGFRFTPQSDGGIKIESIGTHSANGDYYIQGNWGNTVTVLDLSDDTYAATISCETIVSGISLRIFGANNSPIVNNISLNNETNFTGEVKFVFITVISTAVIPSGGIIVYPMIRHASITDSTFVPYGKTNRELTVAENEDRAALIGQVDEGAKNLISYSLESIIASNQTNGTWSGNVFTETSGITFTVNNDMTITANGTATALASFRIVDSFIASANSVLSGCPAGGSITTYDLRIGTTVKEYGDGYFINTETTGNLSIVIRQGQILSNIVFKPMLCTKADWVVSQKFVPYRPSYDDLIDEVSQLKNYTGYEKSQILGLQVDYQNKTFTRLAKAVDLTPGSDFNQFNIYNKRRRCNVSDDGTINAFYGENSYIEDGTNGQVMVYQPKFYYKVEPLKLEPIVDGEGYHIRKANYYISETPRNGFKLHPAFKDENGNELEYYLIGAYEASLYDVSASTYILDDAQVADFSTDKICSIASAKPMSGATQNLTRSNCEKLATNRGTRWHNMTIQIASAEQLLFMIEYGKMNAQEAIGKGVVNKASGSGNEAINTGLTSDLGNASGTASGTDGLVSITYRGVENLWGNIWSWIDGINIWGDGTKKGGIPYITDKLSFEENTRTGYNSTGFTTSGTNGYISAMGYGNPDYDWIFFASETTGNSTLPVGDYQYYSTNLNGYRVAKLGGGWSSDLAAGLFYWNLADSSSIRSRSIGGRGVSIPDINATNYWTNIHKAN